MSGSNSALSLEAAELTDLEAARLAHQVAAERFLPISARHYEAHLALSRRGGGAVIVYDRRDLESVWMSLLSEAVLEVETVRDPVLVKRLQAYAREALKLRYPEMNSPAQSGQAVSRAPVPPGRAN